MRESKLQTKCIALVKDRGGKADNIWGGGFQKGGISDLLICYKGRHIAAELKVGYNKCSCEQKDYLHETKDAGGIAVVVRDTMDELIRILNLIDEGVSSSDIQATIQLPERCNQGVGEQREFRFIPGYGSGKNNHKSRKSRR